MLFIATDTNWFYSTLAQATAAIVGLAGAFLIQRLLIHRSEIGPARQEVREVAQEVLAELHELSTRAKVVSASLRDALREVESRRKAGRQPRVTTPLLLFGPELRMIEAAGIRQPPTGELSASESFSMAIEDLRQFYEFLDQLDWAAFVTDLRVLGELRREPPIWQGKRTIAPRDWLPMEDDDPRTLSKFRDDASGWRHVMTMRARGRTSQSMWRTVREQRRFAEEHLGRCRDESRNCGIKIEILRSRLMPQSLYYLLGILAVLLVIGVIVPMFFLSAESGPSKYILLGLFALFVTGFLGFYGYELRRLRRADRLVEGDFW